MTIYNESLKLLYKTYAKDLYMFHRQRFVERNFRFQTVSIKKLYVLTLYVYMYPLFLSL